MSTLYTFLNKFKLENSKKIILIRNLLLKVKYKCDFKILIINSSNQLRRILIKNKAFALNFPDKRHKSPQVHIFVVNFPLTRNYLFPQLSNMLCI